MPPQSDSFFDRRPKFKIRKRTSFSKMQWNKSEMTRKCNFCSERSSGKRHEFWDASEEIASTQRRDLNCSGWFGSSFPMQGKRPRIPESSIWLVLKKIVFVICIVCFLYQCVMFCIHYYSYPTTISITTITPKIILKPAITFCNFNYFNRTYLCNEQPEFCEKPGDSDLKDYCLENPAICIGDTSDLLFPKRNMSNSTRQEFHKAMYDIQLTHNTGAGSKIVELSWTGNSPDLDPIENLWPHLKTLVRMSYSFEYHTGDSMIWLSPTLILRESTLGDQGPYLSSPSIDLTIELAARRLFSVPPHRKGTIHLLTSMPSPGFKLKLNDTASSVTSHYTRWVALCILN
ncbi:hypothetical protein TNCV_2231271 [Trichonephila clavipes]|nr:hypothetical protein TNCV_2231271 [Trichonephila clavipes]